MNKKKVQRLVQKLGIQVTSYRRKSRKEGYYKGAEGRIAPNRLRRRFHTSVAHQKITTDTTEMKYYEKDASGKLQIKKLYLNPFLDLYNLEVISYQIAPNQHAVNILIALEKAIKQTADCPYRRTFHSDQGWGYQMHAYRDRLHEEKIYQSMSRRGNCFDNAPVENFFALLKQEIYYGRVYTSYEELKEAIEAYILYYNQNRIKERLGFLSPVEYRLQHAVA